MDNHLAMPPSASFLAVAEYAAVAPSKHQHTPRTPKPYSLSAAQKYLGLTPKQLHSWIADAATPEGQTRREQNLIAGLPALVDFMNAQSVEALHKAGSGQKSNRLNGSQREEAATMIAAGYRGSHVAQELRTSTHAVYSQVKIAEVQAATLNRAARLAKAGVTVKPSATDAASTATPATPAQVEAPTAMTEAAPRVQIAKPAEQASIATVTTKPDAVPDSGGEKPKSHASIAKKRAKAADLVAAGYARRAVAEQLEMDIKYFYKFVTATDVKQAKARRADRLAAGLDVIPEATRGTASALAKEQPSPTPVAEKPAEAFVVVTRGAPAAVISRPIPPQGADLLLVPLVAASSSASLQQQQQPPFGWTAAELWNGFIAINGNLREAHKTAKSTDPLIDLMMRRFTIQGYTPERIAEERDEFIRACQAQKFPGLVRKAFLLVSHQAHKVLGEVWQDHVANSPTPNTVFVLDPKLAARPKLDNILALVLDHTGKSQQYRSFKPTKAVLSRN